jgi:hypothetical protein
MDIFSQGSTMRTDNAQHADGLTGALLNALTHARGLGANA